MRSAAALLALVASAFAYQVTFPTATEGWTNSGDQTISWVRVDTDPTTFTALLVNVNDPSITQQLAAQVDGTLSNLTVGPPSAGWPSPGAGYRVNFVLNTTELNTILAQSAVFSINASTSTSSSASSTTGTVSSSGTTLNVATTATTDTSATDAASSAATTPFTTGNSAAALGVKTGLFGVVALVGALLF